jgi:hypothetical protein
MEAIKLIRGKISGPAILLVLFFAIGTPVHANVNIAPISVNFGNQTVGTSSAPIKMTLTNATRHKTSIVNISSSMAQFSYSWPSLPFTLNPGQKLTGGVTFTPAALQTYSGTLAFTTADGLITVVSLTGMGVQAQPSAAIQPATEIVAAGQSASFSASTSGVKPLGYQWKKNGTTISGATSSAYTTPPTTTSDNGAQFTVIVSNSTGSTSSNPATLTVIAAVVAPSITAQPVSQVVTVGQAATFSAAAAGTAPLSYQWMKNGLPVAGATSSTFTTPASATSDTGSHFTITVSNSTGNVTSNAATLTVNAAPVAPAITTQPARQTLTAGQAASFSVAVTGAVPLTYLWVKNGAVIAGATSSTYTTPATTTADSGSQFTVTVSNSVGNVTSSAATLTVNAASPCLQSSSTAWTNKAFPTQTAQFTTTYDSTPSQANMDGVVGFSLNAATGYTSLAAITRFASTGMIDAVNGGFYSADTVVPYVSGLSYHFRLVIDPTSQHYSVYVTPSGGTEVALATNYTFRSEQSTTSSLNNWGMISEIGSQSVCNMTIWSAPASTISPAITTQPARQTVTAGQPATFSVVATGTPPLSYQWMKSGAPIAGATSSSYTTPVTTTADSGSLFSITVSNSAGSMTSNAATLTVNAAVVTPSITTQPVSRTVTAGQTASFSVAATSTAPLSYQWMKSGAPIAGATSSSYTTPVTTTADSGSLFSITVSNSAGNVTSNPATLTVNAVPGQLTASASTLSFGNVNIGTTSNQSVTFTNSGNANITISSVIFSGSGAGFNMSGLSNGLILGPGQTATLTVTFAPAAIGSVTDSVTITSNAANSPALISLSGTGFQPPISHSVTLSWVPSTSTVIGYNAYRAGVSGGAYSKLNSSPVTTAQLTDFSVQSGQTYYYVVTSVDSNNVESIYSNEVPATIP